MDKIFVNCGGSLYQYDSKKDVMDFFEDCIYGSEGSERARYTEIYFSVKEHLNDSKRCFTDGSSHVYVSNIDPDEIDSLDEDLLKTNFNISKMDLLEFKADRCLTEHFKVYPRMAKDFADIDDLYEDYLSEKDCNDFYYFKDNKIICIDTSASGSDKYWVEEFPLEDYEYANKWLNGELEYSDYLEEKNKGDMEL